jgi:hypothetical protein
LPLINFTHWNAKKAPHKKLKETNDFLHVLSMERLQIIREYDFNQLLHKSKKYLCVSFMLRYIVAIFLLTAFAAQSFQQVLIVADYYANTASFASHCENKSRPMMHCNGKCQMMKKMKEEERKEQQNPERKSESKTEVSSSSSFFASLPRVHISFIKKVNASHIYSLTEGVSSSIFHPPCAA